MEPEPITLTDPLGRRIDAELVDLRTDGSLLIRDPEGQRWRVPADAIVHREGTNVNLRVELSGFAEPSAGADAPLEREVVPLVEERVVVEKHERPTAVVRVRTRTHEHEETVAEVLAVDSVHVERVPIDRFVDAPGSIRVEGDTTVIPVYEEVLIVEKRLLLKEEVRLTKRTTDRTETKNVTVRHQSADIERTEVEE